jgi:autotransporter-associated beta strand protein
MLGAVLAAVVAVPVAARPAFAAADITADVRANRDVTLAGDSVINLPAGTTTYTGAITGEGTLTVAGTGTLILTRDCDFTIPAARRTEQVATTGGNHPSYTISNPDPPAVTVHKGATLQYGTGGATGVIGHFPYQTRGFALNALNIRVDGTLNVDVTTRLHLGIMSGSGFIVQPRFVWPGVDLAGNHPFSGVLYNGTGMNFGSPYFMTYLPNVRKILNQGSATPSTPQGQTLLLKADVYSRKWGNDINFHSAADGLVVMAGVYSWADAGPDEDPSLSDPSLNFKVIPHRDNTRGINIEGANVQWGDGTGNRFFLPGNKDTVYINMHAARNRSRLSLDYNGPVTLSAPISGGIYHDTLSAVGQGDVVIVATKGNFVTFAAPQNYNGTTTIGAGATLRLGNGSAGGDGSLLTSAPLYRIVNDGALIVQNATAATSLSRISGSGSLTQAGAATTTLTGQTTYTGATTISAGTLALRGGDIAASSGVQLTSAGARLDLSRPMTIKDLSGTAGTIALGSNPLTIGTGKSTTFGGSITGIRAGLTKVGAGTLTLTGKSTTPGGTWQVRQGGVQLEGGSVQADVAVSAGAALSGAGAVTGRVSNAGNVAPGPGASLRVSGDYVQSAGGKLVVRPGGTGNYDRLSVAGAVSLAGGLQISPGTVPDGVRQITVIKNDGAGRVSGIFDGLAEGAALTVAGTTYHISYAGGDGNDVVLTIVQRAAGAGDAGNSGVIGALTGGTGSSPFAIAAIGVTILLVLAAAVLLGLLIRRRSKSGRAGSADRDQSGAVRENH